MMAAARPTRPTAQLTDARELQHTVDVVRTACLVAGQRRFLDHTIAQFEQRGLMEAVRDHNTAELFAWLLEMFSFQGVSDRVAESYLRTHGSVSWQEVAAGLETKAPCPRLANYWMFDRCGYDKGSGCCS